MDDLLNINQCNIAQIIGESSRFLFHVTLVHFTTTIIDGKTNFLSEEIFRTLLITAIAIAMYHVFFRKLVEPKIEKMKIICYDTAKRLRKKKELIKVDQHKSNLRAKTHELIRKNGGKEPYSNSSRSYTKRKSPVRH